MPGKHASRGVSSLPLLPTTWGSHYNRDMARRRPASIRALRGLLLVFLLALVGGIAALFVYGRPGRLTPGDVAEREKSSSDRQFTVEIDDFRQAVTRDGKVVFEIAGDTFQRDREDNVYLRGVTIHADREQGAFVIRGDGATFHQERQEARLEGNVEVEGPGGLRMLADWFELTDGGRTLVSSAGVRFSYGEQLVGTSGTFHLDFDREKVSLGQGVEIETVEGIVPRAFLHARRMEIDQVALMVRAADGATVGRAGDRLEAKRLTLYMDSSGKRVERINALWNVRGMVDPSWIAASSVEADPTVAEGTSASSLEGEPASADPAEARTSYPVRFAAKRMASALDRMGEPKVVELNGYQQLPARIEWKDADRAVRTVRAVRITGDLADRRLTSVRSSGEVELVERSIVDGEPRLRRVAGDDAEATFDADSELARLIARGNVRLRDGDLEAVADRANLHPPTRSLDLFGEPEAEITTSRGNLKAPDITYSDETGLLRATPRARAVLTADSAGALGGRALGTGSNGQVQVEADEALLRDASGEFVFLGDVRAWQGKNVLVCDQLRGDDQGQLAASGNVRTLWFPPEETEGDERPAEEVGSGKEEVAENSSVAIQAELMTYDENLRQGALRYEGAVKVRRQGMLIDCDDLVVDLDAEGEAESMHCVGNVVLRDPTRDAVVRGDRADYSIVDEVVDVYGTPLTAEQSKPQRRKLTGKQLRYRLADGAMTLGGGREGAAKEGASAREPSSSRAPGATQPPSGSSPPRSR